VMSTTSVLPTTPQHEDAPSTPTVTSPPSLSNNLPNESAVGSPLKDDRPTNKEDKSSGKEERQRRRGSMRDAILAVSAAAAGSSTGGTVRRPWRQ
jgi:hypothetical protein